MCTRGSHKLQSLVQLLSHRLSSSNINPGYNSKLGNISPINQGLRSFLYQSGTGRQVDTNMFKDDKDGKVRPPVTAPARHNIFRWTRWLLGSILTLLLPFWKEKWQKLRKIEGEAEMVVEEVRHVTEVVEKVATVAENVSMEVADALPEQGKLKKAALLVERVSNATAQEAHFANDIARKVHALEQDVDDLETLVEPIVDKIGEKETKGKRD
ncbi:hypothetical protein CFOL_v3_31294 [Cephalotus follicularis]|uniref:Uncharacterized protein n=1 Tax=Cephalotus follicularis TaxID=3775 RepID=A0A1Q3D5Y2_CEPFO|nr:hypothetical protein CFOL_v3_31294 [Cephalotus follicularis]